MVRERTALLAALVEDLKSSEEEARQASRSKSEFLANMSHEIRTPMNAVLGMTTVLGGTELTLEQGEYLETIRTSGESLLALVNDLLDVSKIEAGMLQTESVPFALRPCVDETVSLLAASAARKGLEIGCLVDEGVPVRVLTDVARLRQILLNLLSNAVKFTPRGEVFLTVASRPVEGDGGVELELTVRDTGIGIPADRLDRLFRPFSQVDSSTTRLYGGTGLGLAISRRLTEILGGRMWVTSEPEHGSEFHFTVRCTAEHGPPPPYLEPRPPLLDGRRLLIVTGADQPARIVGWHARRWGMETEVATSKAAALDRLASGGFDLALLDAALGDPEDLETACHEAGLPWVRLLPGGVAAGRSRDPGPPSVARPIKGLLLHWAVLKALGHELPRPAVVDADLSAGLTAASPAPLRILVAEDNSVNQKVLLLLLARLGYTADMAANGLEVLAALRRLRYDLVFMDVQMPEMDGLEAARHIRREWPPGEQPRIVAMTASAMREDREACLAAGMDGYLSKPLALRDLRGALQQTAAETVPPADPVPPPPAPDVPLVLDATRLERLRGLEEYTGRPVVKMVVESFLTRAPQDLAEMRDALRAADWPRLAFKAHTLKGSGLQIGVDRLADRLQELENEGRDRQKTERAEELLHYIEEEFRQAAAALEEP
jgi:CheY-like chemotaxis protein/nitrogen-specific signal transduction histidine kinase/HPt (histidine-containing phosphotransfer) domain-containing protein